MKLINVINNSKDAILVPARGGLSVVLAPGEKSNVCPEGRDAQGMFWRMVARGVVGDSNLPRRASFHPAGMQRSHRFPHAA